MNTEFGSFLTMVASAVITAALPVLLAMLVAWLNKKVGEAKTHLTASQLRAIEAGVAILVKAAEQSGLWKAALATGAQKKAWVLAQAVEWCNSKGLPVDLYMLDAQIEAIVRDMNWDDAEAGILPAAYLPALESTASTDNLQ
jgi:hypothetical protein